MLKSLMYGLVMEVIHEEHFHSIKCTFDVSFIDMEVEMGSV